MTIALTEYEALKTAATSSVTRMKIASYRTVSGSKIARNPDLAEFIIANAATMTVEQVRLACIQRFGSAAPSWSSIYRFLEAVKHGGARQRDRS